MQLGPKKAERERGFLHSSKQLVKSGKQQLASLPSLPSGPLTTTLQT